MEAAAPPVTTGSKTIADLLPRAAEIHGDHAFARHKVDEEWHDVSYAEVVGDRPRDRPGPDRPRHPGAATASASSPTRAPSGRTPTSAQRSAGAVVVPIYPTNSPEECEWVAGQLRGRRGHREDADAGREDRRGPRQPAEPAAHHRDRARGRRTPTRSRSTTCASAAAVATPPSCEARIDAVEPDDPFTFIYTSGTTGPPKGCVLTHGNYRSMLDMVHVAERAARRRRADAIYLFLPLAHSFALLIQLLNVDLGGTIAYFGGDTQQIIPEIAQVKPTYLPSVPRIFEKLYTLAQSQLPAEEIELIRTVGGKIRDLEVARRGGARRSCATSSSRSRPRPSSSATCSAAGCARRSPAPRRSRTRSSSSSGRGVPVLEGYGMTETATAATYSTLEDHKFGTVGRAVPRRRACGSPTTARSSSRAPNIFDGYYKNARRLVRRRSTDGWLHTGDLGLDRRGRLPLDHRPQEGHHHHRGRQEPDAGQHRERPQADAAGSRQAVMHGDRRPFPVMLVTLDEEEIVPWAQTARPRPSRTPRSLRSPRTRGASR